MLVQVNAGLVQPRGVSRESFHACLVVVAGVDVYWNMAVMQGAQESKKA